MLYVVFQAMFYIDLLDKHHFLQSVFSYSLKNEYILFLWWEHNQYSKITEIVEKHLQYIYIYIYMYLLINVFNNQARVKYD